MGAVWGSANAAYDEFAVAFGPPPAPPQPEAEEIPEGLLATQVEGLLTSSNSRLTIMIAEKFGVKRNSFIASDIQKRVAFAWYAQHGHSTKAYYLTTKAMNIDI